MNPIKISLDFYKRNIVSINVKQLDDMLRVIEISCTSNGKKVILDNTTTSAFIRYKKPDGYYVLENPEITSDGIVRLILKQSMLSESGRCIADIMLINSSDVYVDNIEDIINSETLDGVGIISTMSFYVNVDATAINHSELADVYKKDDFVDIVSKLCVTNNHAEEAAIQAEEAVENVNNAMNGISDAITNANNAADNANNAANNVSGVISSAEEATVNANNAVENANNAINSVNDAITNANNAADNANNAASEAVTAKNNTIDATNNANEKIEEMQSLIENINDIFSGVVRDDIVSETTTYSSKKIEESVSAIIDDTTVSENSSYSSEKVNYLISNLSNSNLLINGDFQVWQRGESFTFNSENSYCYIADRWSFYVSESLETFNKTIVCERVENGLKLVSCNRGNAVLTQLFETPLVAGTKYMLSAKINGVLYSYSITGGEYDVNSEEKRLLYSSPHQGVYERVSIRLYTNDVVEWVKLEQGTVATPFVPKTYIEELLACQRYYYVLPYAQYIVGVGNTGVNIYIHSDWVRNNMRDAKTIIYSSIGKIAICLGGSIVTTNVNSILWKWDSIEFYLESNVGKNQAAYMYYGSENGYIAIDAEIY